MIAQGFELIKTTIEKVYPSPVYLLFFVLSSAAALYLLIRARSKAERLLGGFSVFIAVTFLLPPFAWMIKRFLRDGDVYWRYLWLLPSAVLIPYMCVKFSSRFSKKALNVLTALILMLAIAFGGKNLYASGAFRTAVSREKLAERTMIAANVIEENIAKTGNTYAYLAAPFQVSHEIREVTSDVKVFSRRFLDLTYLRENYPKRYYLIQVLNRARTDDKHKAAVRMRKLRCNYVLIDSEAGCDEDLLNAGYEIIYAGDGWNLWYHPGVKPKTKKKKD